MQSYLSYVRYVLKPIHIVGCMTFMVLISACKNTSESPISHIDGEMVKVLKSSGDDFSFTLDDTIAYFVPHLFNLGTSSSNPALEEVLIISRKLEPGKEITVKPFGIMHVSNDNGIEQKVSLAYPSDRSLQLFEIRDFNQFSVEHFAIKHMIEYWYTNRYGLDGSRILSTEPYSVE